jgi:HPt (histidine-containing phosphotransfer) domain-containing protein
MTAMSDLRRFPVFPSFLVSWENGLAPSSDHVPDSQAKAAWREVFMGNEVMMLDVSEAMQRFSGNSQIFVKLLDRFLELNAGVGEKTLQILEEGDCGNMALFFHSIKGGAGNLSARALYLKASELERLAQAGDAAAVRQQVPTFLDLFERLRRAADDVRNSAL